jgi:hypothetical protein
MPTLWYAKDGRRPDAQRGPGVAISFQDLNSLFPDTEPLFVSVQPPEFNVDQPTQYPVRVVVEVQPQEGTDARFPKVGFYLMQDISPERAQQRLQDRGSG